jgi:hypothetical protein
LSFWPPCKVVAVSELWTSCFQDVFRIIIKPVRMEDIERIRCCFGFRPQLQNAGH